MSKSSKKKRPTPVAPEPIGPLFDSHTHLYSTVRKNVNRENEAGGGAEAYGAGIAEFMDRAERSGVTRVCTVGDGLEETRRALEAAHIDPRVWAAVAVHPTKADTVDAQAREELRDMAQDPRCVAIGETGLDKYWIERDDTTPSLEVQEEAFRWHIDLAVETGKALMIHNREADDDLLRVLADAPQPENVILHCFSSPLGVAREALDRGYTLSFAGNVTFKRNEELRQAAALAPANQILVETDAPYMTAEPFRGARNEPAFVGYTARAVAEARGISPEEIAEITTANACRVFGLA
ncbi:MAG TPA: TatD family hydrolase [Candidatus Corynebacterium gallistercoris]|uniref:TatD family hydrolase n=1 Tax=Candidatus Corynebacterium gallistercoris TaxID=2838530 RepID=A0A9D1RZ63_9CORY|nr:TatD family hydrolase [Candidatus Corynebacterium gallistercoris]